jgi:hypothetical protein
MTYKETLFFIGQSLTINHSTENKIAIEKQLKENSVDWDAVVKVSTGHFVFPALYCNLKRANFLHYLPEELVNYMVHITDLNRERNQKIITQAKEINELLLANNITPIFLKGTGNILEGLYKDIGERMVGDIDFIVSNEEYLKTINILKEDGYDILEHNVAKFHRHYPSLGKKHNIAGVEVHKRLLREKYSAKFNYFHIKDNLIKLNNFHLISNKNQFHYNILVHQINDYGIQYNMISLRKSYDIFLLSKKINVEKYLQDLILFNNEVHCFIAIQNKILNTSLPCVNNHETRKHIDNYYKLLDNKNYRERFHKNTKAKIITLKRINLLINSIYKKEYRAWLVIKIKEKLRF